MKRIALIGADLDPSPLPITPTDSTHTAMHLERNAPQVPTVWIEDSQKE